MNILNRIKCFFGWHSYSPIGRTIIPLNEDHTDASFYCYRCARCKKFLMVALD